MLTVAGLAAAINAKYSGDDVPFHGASIDTRTLRKGEVYIAIKGANFDGHQFIPDAIKKGAGAVVVSQQQKKLAVPQVIVKDTTEALGQLAKAWRAQFTISVIAVTGSCGKTTTKEMIAAILKQRGKVLYTHLNLNNHIGAPLTLLQLKPEHQFAVVEVGTNQPGDIPYLVDIVKPTVGVVTIIREVHLEKLGSLDGVAAEKEHVYKGLAESGVAIINNDEPYAEHWRKLTDRCHQVSFGVLHKADVMAEHYHFGDEGAFFDLLTPLGEQAVAVPLFGSHILINALAAVATTMALGASREEVAKGLASLKPQPGRFCPHKLKDGTLLIDDTYNGSLQAAKSAIDALSKFEGKRIFVMTHMAELGEHAAQCHRALGQYAKSHQLDALLLCGDKDLLVFTQKEAGDVAQYFADKTALHTALKPMLGKNTMVVIKGAHSMHMETIVKELTC